jgi:HlyD family secretion protein
MNQAADPLSVLLHLQHRVRDAASTDELSFIMVNETHAMTPYRQGVLWLDGTGLLALSGVSAPESSAPFTQWLARVCRTLTTKMTVAGRIDPATLVAWDNEEWAEWLPRHGLWLPLTAPDHRHLGGLLLARDQGWDDSEIEFLNELCHAYGHALGFFVKVRRGMAWRPGRLSWMAGLLAVAVAAAISVPLTVLAPAEMVAAHPAVVRSPLDGVIDQFHIAPNGVVAEGAPLFDLNPTTLQGKLEVAEKTRSTAEAEYRLTSQQAVFDPQAKPKLAILSGRMEERAAEAEYLRGQLERVKVKAPRAGIAVLDDPSEWIGRPVSIGERVMTVADEGDTEIEAWLAVADAVDLAPGMTVTMFLNADPLHPARATLRFVGYEAMSRPDGTVAYRLRAVLAEGEEKPRLGLKGTARIEARRVAAGYWLIRRPLSAIRHFVGL